MRLSRTLAALAALAITATGCSGDSNAPSNSHVGSYALITVNNAPLPLTIIDQPTLTVTVHDGALALAANNSYTQTLTVLVVADGVAAPAEHLSCSGSYSHSGSNFTFTSTESQDCSGITAKGTLDGNTLTVTDDTGETLVFRR